MRTHAFYEKHGGKTIVLSRFIPVVRTFAPFVAVAAEMPFGRFQLFNVAGALACGRSGGGRLLLRQHSVHQGPPEHHRAAGPGRRHRAGGRRGPVQADSFAPPIDARTGPCAVSAWPCSFQDVGMGRSGQLTSPSLERRIRGEVTLDPRHHGLRQLVLVRRCSSASSCGLLMKAVSTRMDGMSGALSTAKPACSTLFLCSRLIFLISSRKELPP